MKKLILLLLVTLMLKPGSAFATPLDVSISPALITIKTDGKDELTPKIYIQNKTAQNISYNISLIPFQPSALKNGEPVLQDVVEKDYGSLFQNIIILDDNTSVTKVDLAPQQKKTIKLVINIPPSLKDKDYYFSVVFTSSAQDKIENSTTVNISQALGVNVLLSLGDQSQPQGEIKEFSAPSFVDKDPVSFRIDVKNNSNNFITAQGNILVKNMFGQTIGSFSFKPTNVLANSERMIENTSWNEKILFGFYRAKAEVSLSSSGPILIKETKFFAFPFKYLLLALTLFLFFLYLRLRIIKKRFNN